MILANSNELLDRHRIFLIDAYGVLVTSRGALPGAQKFISELERRRHEYFIVTNDASRLPETAAAFYASKGLNIPVERVLTAGLAIEVALKRHGLNHASCAVLGTKDSHEYILRAGGKSVEITEDSEFDALVIGDDSGFDILPTLSALITSLHRQYRARKRPALLLANADMLFPRGPETFALASGSLARLLEMALAQLHPDLCPTFEVLGKPSALLFEMALERSGGSRTDAVMLGDQLHTDVRGANLVGISSALLMTGLTRQMPRTEELPHESRPTYVLHGL